VAYRETISQTVKQEGLFDKPSAGKPQFGHVRIELEPGKTGSGLVVRNLINDDKIPKTFIPAIERGVMEAFQTGPSGYPLIDIEARIIDGEFNQESSTELGFKVAAIIAVKDGVRKASPVLMEPYFEVEVVSPEDYIGDIIADLSSRRGRVEGITQRGTMQVITGQAPLSEMFGYVTRLRSLSQGRAIYTMTFSHYEPALIKGSGY
jgi:elongation factor G